MKIKFFSNLATIILFNYKNNNFSVFVKVQQNLAPQGIKAFLASDSTEVASSQPRNEMDVISHHSFAKEHSRLAITKIKNSPF